MRLPNAFCQTVFFAYVLQTFDADTGDADVMGHKVCTDEHLVGASFLVFDAFQGHSVNATKAVEFIVLYQIIVFLGDGYGFAYFIVGGFKPIVTECKQSLSVVELFESEIFIIKHNKPILRIR